MTHSLDDPLLAQHQTVVLVFLEDGGDEAEGVLVLGDLQVEVGTEATAFMVDAVDLLQFPNVSPGTLPLPYLQDPLVLAAHRSGHQLRHAGSNQSARILAEDAQHTPGGILDDAHLPLADVRFEGAAFVAEDEFEEVAARFAEELHKRHVLLLLQGFELGSQLGREAALEFDAEDVVAEEDDHLGVLPVGLDLPHHVLVHSLHSGHLPVEVGLHFLGVDDPLADGLPKMAFFVEEFLHRVFNPLHLVLELESLFSCDDIQALVLAVEVVGEFVLEGLEGYLVDTGKLELSLENQHVVVAVDVDLEQL